MDHVVVQPDRESFRRVARALDEESDGREWERDVADEVHEALAPGVMAVRGALMAMSSGGMGHGGEPLREAVADAVQPAVKLTGRGAGARIRARKSGLPRGFANAPKLFNARSFRHPTPNGDVWVVQVGAPGWFDDTLHDMRPQLRAAVERALQARARRISRKAP